MARIRSQLDRLAEREQKSMERVMFILIGIIFLVLLARSCNVVAGSTGSTVERHVLRDLDRIAAAQERIANALEQHNRKY